MRKKTMRFVFLWASLVALLLPFSPAVYADNSDPPLGACYLGYGKMLEAAQPRQLSLNAHVSDFLYQPGGLEIAYSSSQKNGDVTTQSIRLVGVQHATVKTLLSTTEQMNGNGSEDDQGLEPYDLAGWSGDGRYLLLIQQHYVRRPDIDSFYFAANVVCANVGADPIHLSPVPLPTTMTGEDVPESFTRYWWSPDRSHILFTLQGRRKQGGTSSLINVFSEIYDPKTDRMKNIAVDDGQIVRGWLDASHLLVDDSLLRTESEPSSKAHYVSKDITTGTTAAIPMPTKMPPLFNDIGSRPGSNISPKAAYLRLDDEPHRITDHQKVGTVDSHVLWVRRTQGPKLSSAAPAGLTPGTDNPQAAWSPTGSQIAFIAHGDLFVTDLVFRDATGVEKYAAGEQLTCAEEREVAASNLKQVGLSIFQYCQDYDENFPSGDGWQDKIAPYLGNNSFLSIGGHPVVYHAPADLALAKMDAPADTVLATTDLPCATVTLYADGHVKSISKTGTDTTSGQ